MEDAFAPSADAVEQRHRAHAAETGRPPGYAEKIAVAVDAGNQLLTMALRVDSFLQKYKLRSVVLTLFAVAILGAKAIPDEWADLAKLLHGAGLVAFLAASGLFAAAWVATFRNDDGEWRLSFAFSRVAAIAGNAVESLREFPSMPSLEKLRTAAHGSLFLGLLALVFREFVLLFAAVLAFATSDADWDGGWIANAALAAGGFLVGFGGALWGVRMWRLYQARQRSAATGVTAPESVRPAIGILPPILDAVRDRAAVVALAQRVPNPLLRDAITTIAEWRPGSRGDELDYQYSLFRRFRQRLPEADPQRERYIGTSQKIDLMLAEVIAIELKPRLTTTISHTAIGQIDGYIRAWGDRGPILVVICETDAAFSRSRLAQVIIEKHRAGHPVVLIAAGLQAMRA